VRVVAAGRAPGDADPGRRVPRRRPPDVRGRDAASARAGLGAQRSRRPRRVAEVGADLERGLAAADGRALAQSSDLNTIPVRGFGQKNVVFCGIRTRSTAAARVCATDTGVQRIAALAAPLSTSAAVAAASWR